MKKRIQRLRNRLKKFNLDAILVSNPSNIFYLSNFRGSDSYCLITSDCGYIITDFRYQEQAQNEAKGFEIIAEGPALYAKAGSLIKKLSLKKIGFEPNHLTISSLDSLIKAAGRRFKPAFRVIEGLRVIKDAQELAIIKEAAGVARRALKEVIKDIRPGTTEKNIALKAGLIMQKVSEGPSFDTIVASGPNASMPHARPSLRRIRRSEPIIIDMGTRLRGYNSDLTRTHFVGRIDKYFQSIYNMIYTAQARAIEGIRPGVKISSIDRIARDYISKKGFQRHFGHALGHSIGIDVHEPPGINSKNHSILKAGMVFTIEPGIYIPGQGGVRIEDMVLVTDKGHNVITR